MAAGREPLPYHRAAHVITVSSNEIYWDLWAPLTFVAVICGVAGMIAGATAETKRELQQVEEELVSAGIQIAGAERRAEYLFRAHQTELERYYVQTRTQAAWIFWVGVMAIAAGFLIVGWTIHLLLQDAGTRPEEKIITAVLAAAAGVLSNFVAVIFLRMYGDTIKSMTSFHMRLVGTQHLLLGNFLLSKVEDEVRREQALTSMALAVAGTLPQDGATDAP